MLLISIGMIVYFRRKGWIGHWSHGRTDQKSNQGPDA
jgi:hypothetical protein